ncbi:carbamoyltransferase HypF [Herbaspirillum sp. RTI4]|uniref:Kae1-like domain-containing protein n=1 Tax=Herbaspirillum sp. RTI4 TaxID=3048640 RepID=UPI002AB35E5D|nr:carbamoyltransferase HypF [Herbaspirillum sp. RTI4]MDY7577060.1 carbamoyltransferase HypF [Herbaspirillum sp. RTI4]MEA9982240.1 carbamoyltransferase HypF [Herbaspirillum sp. RTI4]
MSILFQPLPSTTTTSIAASRTILACGAWLKNTACLLRSDGVCWSPVHGDLGDPANRLALEQSVAQLVVQANGSIVAVAHDLHPDFFSTRLAQRIAGELGVPAMAVQHHHAHIGVLMAEYGLQEPVIGLALDGVGLGTDGLAWGGELLLVDGASWRRIGHLGALALPGGDAAAREPWRMAAAVLHALGRGDEIASRFSASVGVMAARTVQTMLQRGFNCPQTTGAGRWFDAAAGALGISVKQSVEAEAAMALEKMAADYLVAHGEPENSGCYVPEANGKLDLLPLLAHLFACEDSGDPQTVARGAVLFHLVLADALIAWADQAARLHRAKIIALGGGCFFNRILTERLVKGLSRRGLKVLLPKTVSCGDSGSALGQAWVARQQLQADCALANQEPLMM